MTGCLLMKTSQSTTSHSLNAFMQDFWVMHSLIQFNHYILFIIEMIESAFCLKCFLIWVFLCLCLFLSAGEEWGENSETYDSSFYKRSLDNDIYIFTAPYINSKKHPHLQYTSPFVTFVQMLSLALCFTKTAVDLLEMHTHRSLAKVE